MVHRSATPVSRASSRRVTRDDTAGSFDEIVAVDALLRAIPHREKSSDAAR